MLYRDALPEQAGIGEVKYERFYEEVDGEIKNRYYTIGNFYDAKVATMGSCSTSIVFSLPPQISQYEPLVTYNAGDVTTIHNGLNFKCAKDGTVGIHPLSKDNIGNWVNDGYQFPYALGDGSPDTFIDAPLGIFLDVDLSDITLIDPDDKAFVFFGGVTASRVEVSVYAFDHTGNHILDDSFYVDMRYRDSLLIALNNSNLILNRKLHTVSFKFLPCVEEFAGTIRANLTDRPVKIHNACRGVYAGLGKIKHGAGVSTTSTSRNVISDEVEKTFFTGGYSSINGTLDVEEDSYLKARYLLMRASSTLAVFYAGSEYGSGYSTLFDQNVTFGKLKYNSVSKTPNDHQFKISTESLSYSVENLLIQCGSSNFAPSN